MIKNKKLAIGLMSGTSADGIDAVLVEISGFGTATAVKQLDFISTPYSPQMRALLLKVAKGDFGGSAELCSLNFCLGELFADACEELCEKAAVKKGDIAFVGSHGHTVYHSPQIENYCGKSIRSTLQIGETAVIAQRMGCAVVGDFRVRDIAAGGQGAPLVPYTEYILFADASRNIAYQNIGGIGNITIIPKGCKLNEITAFDTGPGNMIIDAVTEYATKGAQTYDNGGSLALNGKVNQELLRFMLCDNYIALPPPKTTGRERYGAKYTSALYKRAQEINLSVNDLIATVTFFTAECIKEGIERFAKVCPDRLIIGGGGSMNKALINFIKQCLPQTEVLTNEGIGMDSNSKEAIAFAVLANEALNRSPNNAPAATGARECVIMGKISY